MAKTNLDNNQELNQQQAKGVFAPGTIYATIATYSLVTGLGANVGIPFTTMILPITLALGSIVTSSLYYLQEKSPIPEDLNAFSEYVFATGTVFNTTTSAIFAVSAKLSIISYAAMGGPGAMTVGTLGTLALGGIEYFYKQEEFKNDVKLLHLEDALEISTCVVPTIFTVYFLHHNNQQVNINLLMAQAQAEYLATESAAGAYISELPGNLVAQYTHGTLQDPDESWNTYVLGAGVALSFAIGIAFHNDVIDFNDIVA